MAKTAFYMRQYRARKKTAQSKQMQAVQAVEDKIWQRKTEKVVCVDGNGDIVFQQSGGKNSIRISRTDLARMEGTIATHNHPTSADVREIGGIFSAEDIYMVDKAKLTGVRATAAEGTYSLIGGDYARPYGLARSYGQQENIETAKLKATRQQLQADVNAGRVSVDKGNQQLADAFVDMTDTLSGWLKNNASKYGFTYSFTKRK